MSITRTERLRLRAGDFLQDSTGATAIEYAIVAGGIAVAIVVAVSGVGSALLPKYQAVNDGMGGTGGVN